MFVSATIDEEFADGRGVDGDGSGRPEGHLAVADGEASARLLSDHQGETRLVSPRVAAQAQRVAYA